MLAQRLAGLAVGLTLMACSGDPASPAEASLASPLGVSPRFDVSLPKSRSLDGRYIVAFNRGGVVPRGFTQRVASLGGTIESIVDNIGFAVVTGLTDVQADSLSKLSGVLAADRDAMVQLFPRSPEATSRLREATVVLSASDPTDALAYPDQWDYPQIGADVAWQTGYLGDQNVTVAIIDGGVDYLHPDLVGRVDLTRSLSFTWYDWPLIEQNFPGRRLFTDPGYHGTHVAATVSSNAIVAAGMTTRLKLMAIKVAAAEGNGLISDQLYGILFATNNGADVINLSLGLLWEKRYGIGVNATFNQVLTYANSKGVTVVAAAGNVSRDLDHSGTIYNQYCDVPNVICVSATGANSLDSSADDDDVAFYTNYGRSAIAVAAPGGSAKYIWAACSTSSLIVPECQSGIAAIGLRGTSMAAPHVSGLAALLVPKYGRNPGAIKTVIQRTADDLGQKGTDPYYGKGRINVPRALGILGLGNQP